MNFSLLITVLIALFQTKADIKDISQNNILKWKNHLKKNKIKKGKSKVNYYANHIATYNLILAGDICLICILNRKHQNVTFSIKPLVETENELNAVCAII